MSVSNPKWKAFVDDLEVTGKKLRTNPDGDVRVEMRLAKMTLVLMREKQVELEGVSYDDFVVPECLECSAQGRHNTNVRAFPLSEPQRRINTPFLTPFKAKTRGHLFRRIDTRNHQETLVSSPFFSISSTTTNIISRACSGFVI